MRPLHDHEISAATGLSEARARLFLRDSLMLVAFMWTLIALTAFVQALPRFDPGAAAGVWLAAVFWGWVGLGVK
jgi:hypothetical protein